MKFKRIITIVLDSVGIGAAHDASDYGDEGSDTLGHISQKMNGLNLPTLEKMGLGNLHQIEGVGRTSSPIAYTQRLQELSLGKDTMTGHWEMMGLYIDKPFITFTDRGFPKELIRALEEQSGHEIIGNCAASGTEIIDALGEQHMDSGKIIVYTSADSVLQIAAHEEVFGLEALYRVCKIARKLTMKDSWKVGRVIARPFIGSSKGNFKRTANRHDYALKPFDTTVLETLKTRHYDVISVGKIVDIFDNEGITEAFRSKSNFDGMNQTIDIVKTKSFNGLLYVNLVDFDALWGHRRNPEGYAKQLEEFDIQLNQLLPLIKNDDLLILTADHGNDPTFYGTDHTREEVPVLYYSPSFKHPQQLDKGMSFANIGATIADNFDVSLPQYGSSELDKLV